MVIFSEERHKQDKHRHEVREGEGEEKAESLWMLETKAVWQENAIAVKHFAAPILTMHGTHTHTP